MTNRILTAVAMFVAFTSMISAQEPRPAYGILIDNTGSLRSQFELVIEMAKEGLSRIPSDATVSLFTFATDPSNKRPVAQLTAGVQCDATRGQAWGQIDNLSIAIGPTPLFNSVRASAQLLSSKCTNASKRTLILITDGEDRASSIKQTDLIQELKLDGTKILVIGLVDQLDEGYWNMEGKSKRQKTKEFLEKITKETGGQAVFVNNKKKGVEAVKKLFEVFLSE